MQQKLVQNVLQQEVRALGNNRKRTVKITPNIEKYVYYIFTENICSARASGSFFCKHVLVLYNNDTNFFTLKVA